MQTRRRKSGPQRDGCLEGQLLLAMPIMTDKRFRRSVIYMCSHTAEGAMGLILNQLASGVGFVDLVRKLKIVAKGAEETLPPELQRMSVHTGGPVSTERGFVLHTSDYNVAGSTLRIDRNVSLTATIDILRAICQGEGPQRAMLALGYAGWASGQLEAEIQANAWLHCPADAELIFGPDLELKYDRALSKIGVDPSHLVSDAGHA